MKLEGLEQPPYETTLMGVVHGALNYYGAEYSPAKVYGASGHAFLINVHNQLCPSSPYCWNYEPMYPLLENLGLEVRDLGFFHAGSSPEDRAGVETQVKQSLDEGRPSSLLNMDNQLILGYDDDKLFTARPWPKNPDYPPGTLTFRDWTEFGDEVHVNFFAFSRATAADERSILLDSLAYAVDIGRNPESHTDEPYGVGPMAYDYWLAALDEYGDSHGHWWNATVWSECRKMAAEYLREATAIVPDRVTELTSIAADYEFISDGLAKAANREMPVETKRRLIQEARDHDSAAIDAIEKLLATLM